jgi:hypothetical protein
LPGVFRFAAAPQTERQRLWIASLWAGPSKHAIAVDSKVCS